jgi:hypothetical protein
MVNVTEEGWIIFLKPRNIGCGYDEYQLAHILILVAENMDSEQFSKNQRADLALTAQTRH